MFGLGFLAYVIGSLGMICLMVAYSLGPAGQVAGIVNMQCLLLAITQAIVHKEMFGTMELIGLVLGFLGGSVLVVPEKFE